MMFDYLINKLKDEMKNDELTSVNSKEYLDQVENITPKENGFVKFRKSTTPNSAVVNQLIQTDFMTPNCRSPTDNSFQSSYGDPNFNIAANELKNYSHLTLDLNNAKSSNSSSVLGLGFAANRDVTCSDTNDTFFNITSDDMPLVYPDELRHINKTQLISYSILFPLAAIGNLLVFFALFRNRHRKSRVNLMLLHLSLADMIVTFIFLPTEIIWHINIEWIFGNIGCKVYKYLSAFGFYISSMVLVCISLDRYFAVLHPLKVNDAQRRGKIMLFFAWLISAVISIPQSVIFKVQSHPSFPTFQQCVTFGFFDDNEEMIYTAFVISFLYFIPLTIIIVAYSRIIVEITKKSRETKCDHSSDYSSASGERRHLRLRRSNVSTIERARSRTLGMTFIIVMAFVWCWTPYSICTLWNFIDQDTFKRMNLHFQDILFILAVSNSVVNPIIYGRYSLSCCRKKNEVRKPNSCISSCYFCYWFCCCCLSPVVMETEFRENKLCNASGLTRSTATLNNRSVRFNHCKYFVNGLYKSINPQAKPGGSLNLRRGRANAMAEPELISMVHLGLRPSCESEADEFRLKVLGSIPEEGLKNSSNNFRPILKTGVTSTAIVDTEASSGYSSTQGHCHSFQEIHVHHQLITAWKSPNSC